MCLRSLHSRPDLFVATFHIPHYRLIVVHYTLFSDEMGRIYNVLSIIRGRIIRLTYYP